jgi:Arc/MetJ-type ribon-helix-helix transcriptional regulator
MSGGYGRGSEGMERVTTRLDNEHKSILERHARRGALEYKSEVIRRALVVYDSIENRDEMYEEALSEVSA